MNCDLQVKHLLALFTMLLLVAGFSFSASAQSTVVPQAMPDMAELPGPDAYWPSSLCRACHVKIFEQHSQSMHAKSFENPVFQAEYFKALLPGLSTSGLVEEAKACIACHSPVSYIHKNKGHVASAHEVDPQMSGVTCDFCHTISGYEGNNPGNANYISAPGYQKLGPFRHESGWHHVYSELQTKSEFCAICHNRVNHLGLEIISTFTEWKKSSYAQKGIQCQDCHMNIHGFLTGGQPVYESGKAAIIEPGFAPERKKLYTHRFPGAHSRTQVIGAMTLNMAFDKTTVSPGEEITLYIFVDNSRSGHKMPSGSAELRLLLLDLKAAVGDNVVTVPARSDEDTEMYDVAGKGKFDNAILGRHIPEGSRVYRAICVDEKGIQTLYSYLAASIVFDNRLNASEVRRETYRFKVPDDAKGTLVFQASLHYLPYPASFSEKLGIPKAEMISIASAARSITVQPNPKQSDIVHPEN